MFGAERVSRLEQHIVPNQTAGIRMGAGGMKEVKRRLDNLAKYAASAQGKINAVRDEAKAAPAPTLDTTHYDVLVIGFGCAGTSAALTAADEGKRVLIADRFEAGGSSRRSGGIYYAGGGTRAQREAGIEDTPQNMFNYIRLENDGAVDDSTVEDFCNQSVENFAWLESMGVPFVDDKGKTNYYRRKTSYPPSFATLYQSGNEAAFPWHEKAVPAARGHRAFGEYLTGYAFFDPLAARVEEHPLIDVVTFAPATRLLRNNHSPCTGAVISAIPQCDGLRNLLSMLFETAVTATMLDPTRSIEASCMRSIDQIEREFGRQVTIHAKAVIIAAGGFFYNNEMVKQYAPKYDGFMPLGNIGDNGAGINMGIAAGGEVGRMDRCSAWKFTNPAFAFLRGVLVNQQGERAGNEDVYGATLADYLIQNHNGKGWLVVDQTIFKAASAQAMTAHEPGSEDVLQEDQTMQSLINLFKNNVQGATIAALAEAMGVPPAALVATIAQYNADALKGEDKMFHKVAAYLAPLENGPFYAINLAMVGNRWWATPCMSLGGLRVDGKSGRVIDAKTQMPVQGLYAAGRSAVGIASNYYVSGLSLADGVFSGRRAGQHAARNQL